MLAELIAWWTARIAELLPASWMRGAAGTADAVVIEAAQNGAITALQRRKGRVEPIGLGAAARLAAREPVLLGRRPAWCWKSAIPFRRRRGVTWSRCCGTTCRG